MCEKEIEMSRALGTENQEVCWELFENRAGQSDTLRKLIGLVNSPSCDFCGLTA